MGGIPRCAVAVAAALSVAAPAQAAVVDTDPGDDLLGDEPYVSVTDAGHQDNRLSVVQTGTRVTVTERGKAPLVARGLCKRQTRHRVTCAVGDEYYLSVYAGRGDDAVFGRCPGVSDVSGGAGSDILRGDGCWAYMDGDGGRDRLVGDRYGQTISGGPGRDVLHAGGGRDTLYGDGTRRGHRADLIDGGAGRDLGSWDERSDGVRVDLARGRGPNGDRLRSIEDVGGGAGRDVLIGDARANRLFGGQDTDVLAGRGGRDQLDGGASTFEMSDSDDGAPDRFECGGGRDRVTSPGSSLLPFDCERMYDQYPLDYNLLPTRPRRLGGGRVAVPVVCSGEQGVDYCRRRVTVSAGGRRIARSAMMTVRRAVTWIPVAVKPRPRDARNVRIAIDGADIITDDDGDTGPLAYRFAWRLRCRGAPRGDVCRPR